MAARKPATAAEIVDLLASNEWIRKGHALPYEAATRLLRQRLKTTTRKAYEWLDKATDTEPHDFELISVNDGRISYVNRGGLPVWLKDAGYAIGDSLEDWPHLSPEGDLVRASPDTGDEDFVVLSKDLHAMCVKALELTTQAKRIQKKKHDDSVQGAEQRHGRSLSYIRGLLKAADLPLSDEVFSAQFKGPDRIGRTFLTIKATDAEIDAIAGVLAAHDVEPFPPNGAVTRKPTTPDPAPEELDSV